MKEEDWPEAPADVGDLDQPYNSALPASPGVMRVLRERIAARVVAQLDPKVKRYSTTSAVEEGCRTLADKIKTSGYRPDLVIGWHDPERTYRGSETVANLLAAELQIDVRLASIRERGETREIIEQFNWLSNYKNALVVDDAAYSGRTLTMISHQCLAATPTLEVRFAVLSALEPVTLSNLYYVSTHSTEELLFPWGWSRLIVSFYDLYNLFGIQDQRSVTTETAEWGTLATVAEDFTGTVRLITITTEKLFHHKAEHESDSFLYVVDGKAEIRIRNHTGTFLTGEYLFVPREIAYDIATEGKVVVLHLASRAR